MTAYTLYPPPPAGSIPGLYVHLPFCRSRCAYCAFVSSVYQSDRVDAYLHALEGEMALRSGALAGEQPTTLFIGGGTPSSLTVQQLHRLFSFLYLPEAGGEATCELNPDSVDHEKLSVLLAAGINRCSFGVQTFSSDGLAVLGRRHDSATARRAVAMAVDMGFSSVNIDLITAWPGQDETTLRNDVAEAVGLGVTHISCYNLILEEESRFLEVMRTRGLSEKPDDEVRKFWDITEELLAAHGFDHYEVSNFAKPGFRCAHNVDTWMGREYLGIGAAAHSHIRGRRSANTPDIDDYIATVAKGGLPEQFSEILEGEEKARECAVFWFRLAEGIDAGAFRERTGSDLFTLYREELPDLIDRGIIEVDGTMVRIRHEYHPVLDAVLVDLV